MVSKEKPGRSVVQLSKVVKTYFLDGVEVHALRGVSFTIATGEFIAITGSSGSGKSTLLNMVGVLDEPTSGAVEINGIDVSTLGEDELARMRGKEIGFVFQSFNLQPNMTALENVALPLRIHDHSDEEALETAEKRLAEVGLGDRLNHYPNQLSGGQQQRVAIARALSTSPAILLADEPTGNLDTESGKSIMALLEEINKNRGVTVIMVTHDPAVMKHARRIIRLQDGEIRR